MHGRPGLGDRHVVRHHRAADARRDEHRRRGATSTPSAGTAILAGAERHRLVHGADRDPHADEGRRRASRASTTSAALRFIASVGEPLNPEAVVWGEEALGLPIHDNWWQTETGGIMIANYAAMDIRPGSMGRPLPGIEAAIVAAATTASRSRVDGRSTAARRARASSRCGPAGRRCSAATSHEEERYRKCFAGGWYLTGDLARRDADGYFWFVGRADDVIKSAGHLIGPFEVESALMEHPAVAEAGVIGKPDPVVGEIVKAFVALQAGLRAERGAAHGAARLRAQAARRGGRAAGDRVRRRPAARRAAARSCAGC